MVFNRICSVRIHYLSSWRGQLSLSIKPAVNISRDQWHWQFIRLPARSTTLVQACSKKRSPLSLVIQVGRLYYINPSLLASQPSDMFFAADYTYQKINRALFTYVPLMAMGMLMIAGSCRVFMKSWNSWWIVQYNVFPGWWPSLNM